MPGGEGHRLQTMARQALSEIDTVLAGVASDTAGRMCDEILKARRIACYGVGREGLMMKALCMRLMHLGLDAHVVGDVTTPQVGTGDLLIASAGPGFFSTVMALVGVAREAGLEDIPAFLEIIYPFELADEAVLASITSSVMHCRREYAGEKLEKKQIA